MDMLEQFFSLKYVNRNGLFEGLSIWREEKYRELQGTYPVICLSFAGVKDTNFFDMRKTICQLIADEYARNTFLLEGESLTEQQKDTFRRKRVEMEALRVNCIELRDRALIEFLYSTGVRVSELMALNVGDVEIGKQELIVYGKGSKERKTYLTDGAMFHLQRYLQIRKQEGLEDQPLFATLDNPHHCILTR